MAFRPRNVEARELPGPFAPDGPVRQDPEFFRELSTHFEVQRLEERGVYGKTCYATLPDIWQFGLRVETVETWLRFSCT